MPFAPTRLAKVEKSTVLLVGEDGSRESLGSPGEHVRETTTWRHVARSPTLSSTAGHVTQTDTPRGHQPPGMGACRVAWLGL